MDIPSARTKRLRKLELTPIEEEILEEITRLHRKQDHFGDDDTGVTGYDIQRLIDAIP